MRRGLPRLERHGAAAIAVVAVVAAAGCGDSGGTDATSTAAATAADDVTRSVEAAPAQATGDALIKKALIAAFASGDPEAACETYVTPNYVTTAYGDADGCKAAQMSGAAAKSLRISGIESAGGSATATVVPAGGASSGERIDVILVEVGRDWQVDSARAPNAAVGP